jgi:hypothetical protein
MHRGEHGADAIDERLHAERFDPAAKAQRHHRGDFGDLPDGASVLHDDRPWLVRGTQLLRWSPAGYDARVARPGGAATVITAPSLLDVLRAGWDGAVPLLHPSA